MNILPKKRWHVRTKENIARVRKDEAEAAEKEKQENIRIETANREARLELLKQKSKQKLNKLDIHVPETEQLTKNSEHINLFLDSDHAIQTTNKEHEKEVKEKKEEYEKKIGYLTYLGQDTNEALGKKNWYDVPPESSRYSRSSHIKETYDKLILKDKDGKPRNKDRDEKDGEVAWTAKQRLDPIHVFQKYYKKINTEKSKSSCNKQQNIKSKHNIKETEDPQKKLQKLREARLKREQQEKQRTEMFLSKLNGISEVSDSKKEAARIKPKYNSQFNPELARQNYM